MPLRSVPNTIEALRLTLFKLEQAGDPAPDSAHFAQLKDILLNRIAELEAVDALASSSVDTSPSVDTLPPADPAGLPAATALQTYDATTEVTDPNLKPVS